MSKSSLAQLAKPAPQDGWICVHHHLSPPAYADVFMQNKLFPKPFTGWTVEKTIADMDEADVTKAMNSIVAPGMCFGACRAGTPSGARVQMSTAPSCIGLSGTLR